MQLSEEIVIIVKYDFVCVAIILKRFSNGFRDPITTVAEFCGCVAGIYNSFNI